MENKKKSQLNKFVQLTGVGLQMGLTIYLGVWAGKKLDTYFGYENKTFTIIGTLVALVGSIYSVIKQLNRINDKYD